MLIKPEISRVTRSKRDAIDTYDRLSRWYDWLASGSERPFARIGLRKLSMQAGETVLEIGCGTGQALLDLARAVGGTGKVYGLDISSGMLTVARTRVSLANASSPVAYVQADAAALPLAPAFFDAVFLSFVLELFDSPEIPQALAQCRSILKPGGRICVVALARDERENLPQRIYEWFHQNLPAFVDCRPIDIQADLTKAGFRIQEVTRKRMWGLPVEICTAFCG